MMSPSDADQPAQPTRTVQSAGAGSQAGAAQEADGPPGRRALRRTRMSGVWVGLALSAVVLLLLLVFILENEKKVDIAFFGAHGHLPLGVALLLAAVAGALLVLIPGTVRILQLRRTAHRHHVAARRASSAAGAPDRQPPGGAP